MALSEASQKQFKWQTAELKWFFIFNLLFETVPKAHEEGWRHPVEGESFLRRGLAGVSIRKWQISDHLNVAICHRLSEGPGRPSVSKA